MLWRGKPTCGNQQEWPERKMSCAHTGRSHQEKEFGGCSVLLIILRGIMFLDNCIHRSHFRQALEKMNLQTLAASPSINFSLQRDLNKEAIMLCLGKKLLVQLCRAEMCVTPLGQRSGSELETTETERRWICISNIISLLFSLLL